MVNITQTYTFTLVKGLSLYNIKVPRPFRMIDVPYFRIPLMSYAILDSKIISQNELNNLENFLKSSTDIKTLWIKSYSQNKMTFRKNNLLLKKNGYKKFSQFKVNFWTTIKERKLPEGFSIRYGSFFDRNLYQDYHLIQKKVFKLDDPFQKKVKRFSKETQLPVFIVCLYNKNNKVVAAGGVSLIGDTGWLFGGAVLPRYQGKYLWHNLVSIRQLISKPYGVNKWMLETQTPRIENICDEQFKYTIFEKPLI